jgi:hypothetical protein
MRDGLPPTNNLPAHAAHTQRGAYTFSGILTETASFGRGSALAALILQGLLSGEGDEEMPSRNRVTTRVMRRKRSLPRL